MNLLLLEPSEWSGGPRVKLAGRRLAHVRDVHRAAVGTTLRVGVVGGRVGGGVITRLTADELELDVVLDAEPPPPLPVTLVLALPRPKALHRVLQCIAAMGVKRLLLANAWRVEKSFWASPALTPESIRADLLIGLEQARDTILPDVSVHRLFKPLVEDVLPDVAADTVALVAHPGATDPCPRAIDGRVTLAVGPEGGFIPYEIDLLAAHDFRAVTLGPRILRVEHAIPALLSVLGSR